MGEVNQENGNLIECSFGFKNKIKYIYNKKTNEIYIPQIQGPVSVTLLEAIIKNIKENF